jgi:hypothetical protein
MKYSTAFLLLFWFFSIIFLLECITISMQNYYKPSVVVIKISNLIFESAMFLGDCWAKIGASLIYLYHYVAAAFSDGYDSMKRLNHSATTNTFAITETIHQSLQLCPLFQTICKAMINLATPLMILCTFPFVFIDSYSTSMQEIAIALSGKPIYTPQAFWYCVLIAISCVFIAYFGQILIEAIVNFVRKTVCKKSVITTDTKIPSECPFASSFRKTHTA